VAQDYTLELRDGAYVVTFPDGSPEWRVDPVPETVIKTGDLSFGNPGDLTRGVFFLQAADGEAWIYHSVQRKLVGKSKSSGEIADPTAGPCFAMTPGAADEKVAATSWVGGVPCLPKDVVWPTIGDRSGFFLAQIDCRDVPAEAWGGRGPREGMLALFAGAETPGVRVLCFASAGRPTIPPSDVDGYVMGLDRLGEKPVRRGVRFDPWDEKPAPVGLFGRRQATDPKERIRLGGPHYDYNSGSTWSGSLVLFDIPSSALIGWSFGDDDRLVVLIKPDALERGDFDAVAFDYAGMDAGLRR